LTLPATKLAEGQWINIQTFIIPHYRRLYIKHYSIQGGGRLHFALWDGESWESMYTYNADSYYSGAPLEIYDSYDVGGTPFMFIVEATGAEDGVTASVAFDCQYLGGSLP
jgi:hypothetical protein